MLWLAVLLGVAVLIAAALAVKVHGMRKTAAELRRGLRAILKGDTNALLSVSTGDGEMRQLAADLNTELRELRRQRHLYEQGDRELKEAVTNISHDLRTPLTAICGYMTLLEREPQSEPAARYLGIIAERLEAMRQLTEELLSYSAAVSDLPELPREDVLLNTALEEALADFYGMLTAANIQPEIAICAQQVYRRLNRQALSRIFSNILSNAVKYSDGDLRVCLSEQGELSFSNGAPALNEVTVGRLFDRFYTVETAQRSTGLGLSITRALTEQMGGQISALYERGRLTIRLAFPPA